MPVTDDHPVLFYMDFPLLRTRWEMPSGNHKRLGTDVTLAAIGGMVPKALAAADTLAAEGISVEVVDARTGR